MGTIALLVVFAVIANFLFVFVLNVGGIPGALLAGTPGKRSKGRFVFGSIICSAGQSYLYLAYTAFIVSWTALRIRQGDSTLCWIVAFLCVMAPLWMNLIRARLEGNESTHANPQVEGLHITFIIVLIMFFVFVFFDGITTLTYGWIPYVTHS